MDFILKMDMYRRYIQECNGGRLNTSSLATRSARLFWDGANLKPVVGAFRGEPPADSFQTFISHTATGEDNFTNNE